MYARFRWFFVVPVVILLSMHPVLSGTVNGTFTPVAQGTEVDLTQVGTTDWVHWGLYTEGSINRKSGVVPLISSFRMVEPSQTAYVVPYQYSDNYNGYTWYDGWPAVAVTNTTTGVWAYQTWPINPMSTGLGFQISVPADTTTRILKVYVGAFDARGQLKATLSDGGQYTDTSLLNQGNGPGGVYTLEYRADAQGQTLTVQWTLYQRATLTSPEANVTLQAAALAVTNANNPPLVSLTQPTDLSTFAAPVNIDLTATARDLDGVVTAVEFYQSRDSDGTAEGPQFIGERAAPPYSLPWQNNAPGRYTLTAAAVDDGNARRVSPPAVAYVYGTGGSLAGSVSTPPGLVDLTAEGSADWVHLGSSTNSTVVRKTGVTPQITVSPLATNALQRLTDGTTYYSWSDGTPTTANPGTPTGAFVYGQENGFRITAPASATPRTLRLYVGGYGVQARLEAFLSDFTAAPFLDQSISTVYDTVGLRYEITYSAAAPGQQLVVLFRATQFFDPLWGNVNFQAATLQGGGLEPTPVSIGTALVGTDIELSFPTQAGRSYTVEHQDLLSAGTWTALTTTNGTGSTVTVTDPVRPDGQRFYRVVVQ